MTTYSLRLGCHFNSGINAPGKLKYFVLGYYLTWQVGCAECSVAFRSVWRRATIFLNLHFDIGQLICINDLWKHLLWLLIVSIRC